MLLKEQQEVAAKRAEHGTGAGSGAGTGGGEGEGAGGSASGTGSAGESATRTSEKSGGSQATNGSKDKATGSSSSSRDGGRGGREVATAPEGTPTKDQSNASHVPTDVGDGRDDDVVARQIREAAMAEQDPAIRERLWEEYRRYKRGGS